MIMAKKFTEKQFLKIVKECDDLEQEIKHKLVNLKEENDYFFAEIGRMLRDLHLKRAGAFSKMWDEIKGKK